MVRVLDPANRATEERGVLVPRCPEQTLLHRVVREQLETFLYRTTASDAALPRFVEQELRDYLRCGVLAYGFLRLHCDACGRDRLVPFSCKRRGFCPSCGGRRMSDAAAHLVDRVLPEVPIRQWVLTLPYPLRYRDPAELDCACEPTARRAAPMTLLLPARCSVRSRVRSSRSSVVVLVDIGSSAAASTEPSLSYNALGLR